MFRTNLFRFLTVVSLASCWTGNAMAQYQRSPHQVPGMHVPHSNYQAPYVNYYQGQKPQVWDDQQPVEKMFGALAERSWIRFDYLHWNMQEPGDSPVGGEVTNLIEPLTVFDNLNGGVSTGVGVIQNNSGLGLDDTSGIRGTWGLDLHNADLEVEVFSLHENSGNTSISNIAGFRDAGAENLGTEARPNVVVPLLSNGTPADAASANYLIFDDSFETTVSTQIWGAEAMLLSETYIPGEGATWQWLGGFRYVAQEEKYSFRGSFTNGGTEAATVTQYNATTINNMYGPEVGFRSGINHRWFTLSATPRIAFTLNDYTAETKVPSLAGNATPTGGSESDIEFTPVVQLNLLGEIHVTPHFSLFGGYDFMWIYRMTRPADNVVHDSTVGAGGTIIPDIRQEVDLESFYTRGLSFGCVLRY